MTVAISAAARPIPNGTLLLSVSLPRYVFSANGAFSKLVVSAADENEDQVRREGRR